MALLFDHDRLDAILTGFEKKLPDGATSARSYPKPTTRPQQQRPQQLGHSEQTELDLQAQVRKVPFGKAGIQNNFQPPVKKTTTAPSKSTLSWESSHSPSPKAVERELSLPNAIAIASENYKLAVKTCDNQSKNKHFRTSPPSVDIIRRNIELVSSSRRVSSSQSNVPSSVKFRPSFGRSNSASRSVSEGRQKRSSSGPSTSIKSRGNSLYWDYSPTPTPLRQSQEQAAVHEKVKSPINTSDATHVISRSSGSHRSQIPFITPQKSDNPSPLGSTASVRQKVREKMQHYHQSMAVKDIKVLQQPSNLQQATAADSKDPSSPAMSRDSLKEVPITDQSKFNQVKETKQINTIRGETQRSKIRSRSEVIVASGLDMKSQKTIQLGTNPVESNVTTNAKSRNSEKYHQANASRFDPIKNAPNHCTSFVKYDDPKVPMRRSAPVRPPSSPQPPSSPEPPLVPSISEDDDESSQLSANDDSVVKNAKFAPYGATSNPFKQESRYKETESRNEHQNQSNRSDDSNSEIDNAIGAPESLSRRKMIQRPRPRNTEQNHTIMRSSQEVRVQDSIDMNPNINIRGQNGEKVGRKTTRHRNKAHESYYTTALGRMERLLRRENINDIGDILGEKKDRRHDRDECDQDEDNHNAHSLTSSPASSASSSASSFFKAPSVQHVHEHDSQDCQKARKDYPGTGCDDRDLDGSPGMKIFSKGLPDNVQINESQQNQCENGNNFTAQCDVCVQKDSGNDDNPPLDSEDHRDDSSDDDHPCTKSCLSDSPLQTEIISGNNQSQSQEGDPLSSPDLNINKNSVANSSAAHTSPSPVPLCFPSAARLPSQSTSLPVVPVRSIHYYYSKLETKRQDRNTASPEQIPTVAIPAPTLHPEFPLKPVTTANFVMSHAFDQSDTKKQAFSANTQSMSAVAPVSSPLKSLDALPRASEANTRSSPHPLYPTREAPVPQHHDRFSASAMPLQHDHDVRQLNQSQHRAKPQTTDEAKTTGDDQRDNELNYFHACYFYYLYTIWLSRQKKQNSGHKPTNSYKNNSEDESDKYRVHYTSPSQLDCGDEYDGNNEYTGPPPHVFSRLLHNLRNDSESSHNGSKIGSIHYNAQPNYYQTPMGDINKHAFPHHHRYHHRVFSETMLTVDAIPIHCGVVTQL